MEFQKLVESRRSIREFKEGTVSKEDILTMVACAQNAPSWKNSQTGRFYAATSEEMIRKISAEGLPEFNAVSSKNAALVVTTFEKTRSGFNREGVADNELGDEWGAYDLGMSNMLFCLKAKELGYDTLIMGIRNGEKLRELLEIPVSQEVVAVIAVGKSEQNPDKPKRKPTEDITKFF